MSEIKNPFEYDAATNLSLEQILDFYIEDFNYSRFIESTRNVFLIGERGSGKTMTLLYNVYRFRNDGVEKGRIGVYVPCKTPLFYKKEYELIQTDPYKAAVISEHFFVLAIAYNLIETIIEYKVHINEELDNRLMEDFAYMMGSELQSGKGFLQAVLAYINRENYNSQKALNKPDNTHFYEDAQSFFSFVLPLINYLKKIPQLKNCHFHLMIDDAHDLNDYQIRALNSWIAYRDHSDFSFKVASAKIRRPKQITSTGGSILEGHDFLSIDLEEPFQNKFSNFGKLARSIINKRLRKIGVENDASAFFPENASMSEDLKKSEKEVKKAAEKLYNKGETKKIGDWVYKYKRAHYFKNRSAQANLPPYSGLETIVQLSTGVVRNLLYPCYWMYDKSISESTDGNIKFIPPNIQTEIIKEKSEEIWNKINNKLYNIVDDCSTNDAKLIKSLFENLALLFKERLKAEISEPRAIAFSISGYTEEYSKLIDPLLRISQEAQILYTRIGPAKEEGKREVFYVPNRMLWPIYGLDPVGQHARVSLKAADVWAAANGKPFPFVAKSNFTNVTDLFSENEQ